MTDINKLPNVTQSWPAKAINSVHKKVSNNKKKNRGNEQKSGKANDEDNKHIDEYV